MTCVVPATAAPVWADPSMSPDQRAAALVAEMTREEKLQLVASNISALIPHRPADAVLGGTYVAGIPRLGVPPLEETDASLGVANLFNIRRDDVATALPATVALAASFDPALAQEAGAMIGAEARAKRFNVMLAGGVNLTREPRGGRTFEYMGEDPLLAGVMAGAEVRGIQSNRIVSTVKHFALNDQESGRQVYDIRIGEAAARESDLLAFEIAIEQGRPGAVMSAYNQVNGVYASESPWLLQEVLKRDWHFPGWVMSDWGNVHSAAPAANAGLDQQSGQMLDPKPYFGAPLASAVASDEVPAERLDDMARRILRSLIAAGVYDRPTDAATAIDYDHDAEVAKRAAEHGLVLLKNSGGLLPLPVDTPSVAVIGGHADLGVLAGGGSSQVRPVGGPALEETDKHAKGLQLPRVYDPSPPLAALQAEFPHAKIIFDDGSDSKRAAAAAASARVAIVFAEQWRTESVDLPSLALPNGQEGLIEAVAAANRNTIVVLESGGAVTMPWLSHVRAVIEAWFPGQKGGSAIARGISGAVNPSGHLPLTFPATEGQLPRPIVAGLAGLLADPSLSLTKARDVPPFTVDYGIDGADVGYRWYAARHMKPLFPFGFGLSYTRFTFSGLHASGGETIKATLKVRNDGTRAGVAVPQVYAIVDTGGSPLPHLIGWQTVALEPGQTKTVAVQADPRLLARFDVVRKGWHLVAGKVRVFAGTDATDEHLTAEVRVQDSFLPP